ncbi:MAG: TonB-dependent copper receptor [Idiomarina sp.]|nr:TonB-dependent copper receptor [Idiomarina sp.]
MSSRPRLSAIYLCIASATPMMPAALADESQQDVATENTTVEPEIERIRVTGQPMLQPTRITLSTKTLRQPLPAQDGADFLRSITGFSNVRKGGASADPVFRGMSGSRLTILTDGDLTLGGCPSRMDPPTAYISPQAFETVTLVKGPQQVTQGPMTAAGTVTFERDWQQTRAPGMSGYAATTVAGFGRVDSNLEVTGANSNGFVNAVANVARADDYQDGDGQRVNSAYQRWNTNLSGAWTPDDQRLFGLQVGLSDGEAAYADRGMDGSKFRRENISLRYMHKNLTDWFTLLETQLFYNNVDHVMDNFSLRTFTPGMMPNPAASNPDRRTQGGRVRATLQATTQLEITTGIDGQSNAHRSRMSMNQPVMPYQQMPRVGDADIEQFGIFAQAYYSPGLFSQWVAGLRADRWRAKDQRQQLSSGHGHAGHGGSENPTYGETRSDALWGGFLRYEERIGALTWYAGGGYTERFPDYWELIGGNRQAPGAANAFRVRHETTTQADVGVIWQGQAWGREMRQSMSVYYGHTDDFLLLESRSMGEHTQQLVRNIDTHHYGFEWDTDYQFNERWQAQASMAYARATNRSDQRALAQQPPLEGRFGLSWQHHQLQLGGLVRVAAKQSRVAQNQGTIAGLDSTPTSGFAVFSLNASWQHDSGLRLSSGIDNLFDRTYAEHLSRSSVMISGYLPTEQVNEPGRLVWANISYAW